MTVLPLAANVGTTTLSAAALEQELGHSGQHSALLCGEMTAANPILG